MLELLLALPPGQPISPSPGLTPVHMAYRIGPGPKLFGVRMAPPPQGSLMMVDCRDFDGEGDPTADYQMSLKRMRAQVYGKSFYPTFAVPTADGYAVSKVTAQDWIDSGVQLETEVKLLGEF